MRDPRPLSAPIRLSDALDQVLAWLRLAGGNLSTGSCILSCTGGRVQWPHWRFEGGLPTVPEEEAAMAADLAALWWRVSRDAHDLYQRGDDWRITVHLAGGRPAPVALEVEQFAVRPARPGPTAYT